MTLHRIGDDLRDHNWYEELFVRTIGEVEAFVGRWAAFEEAAAAFDDAAAEPASESPAS